MKIGRGNDGDSKGLKKGRQKRILNSNTAAVDHKQKGGNMAGIDPRHRLHCLSLLPSGPDEVHNRLLRGGRPEPPFFQNRERTSNRCVSETKTADEVFSVWIWLLPETNVP